MKVEKKLVWMSCVCVCVGGGGGGVGARRVVLAHGLFISPNTFIRDAYIIVVGWIKKFRLTSKDVPRKLYESGFRPPLCTYRLN